MKWLIKGLLWWPSHALDQLAVSLDWNTLPHMACQAKQSGGEPRTETVVSLGEMGSFPQGTSAGGGAVAEIRSAVCGWWKVSLKACRAMGGSRYSGFGVPVSGIQGF